VKLLIEGRPGSGKTTAARRILSILSKNGADVAGFTTAEIRHGRGRAGFSIETVDGRTGILAHVDFDGPRVGKYGVDLRAFEDLVLPALEDRDNDLVATVHVYRHPFTERLKRSPASEVVKITNANRDALPTDIAAQLLA